MPPARRNTQPTPDAGNGAPAPAASAAAPALPDGLATVMFDRAFQLSEEYTQLISTRKANREGLRNLAAQGLLTDEDKELLAEIYPEREKESLTPEERAQRLEAKAADYRKKAEEKAAAEAKAKTDAEATTAPDAAPAAA